MKRIFQFCLCASIMVSPLLLIGCDGDPSPDAKYTMTATGSGAEIIKSWSGCTNITHASTAYCKFWCKGKYIEINGKYIMEQE